LGRTQPIIETLLTLASIGTFLCIGVKIPHKVFLSGKTEGEAHEPEWNMLAGMGFMSALCIITGVYPKVLYDILPFEVHFHPYTPDHVAGAMGILLATIVGYKLLYKSLVFKDALILDTDWFYRKFGGIFLRFCSDVLDAPGRRFQDALSWLVAAIGRLSKDPLYEPEILITETRANIAREFDVSTPVPTEGEDLETSPTQPNPQLERLLERGRGFDENFYRKPVGWPVLVIVMLFFVVAWIFIELS
jgi:hypothetical protein